ncbi:MAG: hypothetical protein ACUVWR_14660 [Anaerolineae bacterium]
MFNLYSLEKYAELYQQRCLEEAARQRLIRALESERSNLWQRLASQLGRIMIASGLWLEARANAPRQSQSVSSV